MAIADPDHRTFADKARLLSDEYLRLCLFLMRFDPARHLYTKQLFSRLIASSQILEDFLDYHGAKNNTDWYFYRELAAAVRHLSLASYSQKHIINRLQAYGLAEVEEFARHGRETLDFLTRSLVRLAPVVILEAERLRIQVPETGFELKDFTTITTTEMLDSDIRDADQQEQKKHIVTIASDFLKIAASFESLSVYEPLDLEEARRLVPERVNEVEIRRYEMLVHNLQSAFDTYVIHGGYRFGNRPLKQLRGYFSVVLHLLQIMGRLLHFYERHLHTMGYKNTYQRVQLQLAALIDPARLLDRTLNYGLLYVCHFLSTGRELARQILNENIERGQITVGIPVKLGFHSRPSLMVAKVVQHYGGQVELVVGSDRFDASSVLDIQWAGGKIHKENIAEVRFEGDVRALKDILVLAGVNYGEDSMGKGIPLPEELTYLR
jgi:phosphotransferase system HPr-like phosphotransfer protein